MSDSDGENFNMDVFSDQSDFPPPVKKGKAPAAKPAPKKAAPAKATTKPKATKKTPLASIDDNVSDRMVMDDGDDSAGSDQDENPKKKQPVAASSKKNKSATETYQKLSQLEHILKRPDSYIGSVETITEKLWSWDSESKRMVYRDIKYVPGFFKIVDEILVNAADNKINDPNMDTLRVNIDTENNSITVYNNGHGIPIEIHAKEKIYIPELIFGNLLTSSNYDDDEKKLTGGRNGYGAKLANIYSTEFIVETADRNTGQKYKQVFSDNMSKKNPPKITKGGKNEEYTKISFKPDLKRFGMNSIDRDTEALLKKRVYDMAGTVRNVKVYLNDERIKIKNFKEYVQLYLNSAAAEVAELTGGAAAPKNNLIHEEINERWEVAFALSDSGNFQQVSFANSISTIKGGTHVNCIADQVVKALQGIIDKKNKAAAVKPQQIKNHMWIFVNALIENPTFDSQTKETLTLPASKFGGKKPALGEEFMKKVNKSGIVDTILNWAKFKADQQIKKTDGAKRARLNGLTKLSDANNAGGRGAAKCTLILTEGDSAKALAEAGLTVVGRDNFGVFPLKGKMLNVREASHDQIMKNQEIQNIKKIMGLQHNKVYEDVSSLRYGSLMIMADQDHDGSHIKGLLINFLDHFYPSLLRIPGFLVEFVTPIVRVRKGNQKIDFFTLPEFEKWNEENNQDGKWTPKYFKGLGTSKDEDAMEYFGNTAKHVIPFSASQEDDRHLIDMAFSKKRTEERKDWLRKFKPGTFVDHDVDEISYTDFINKELILFSMADNIRSIPSVVDGLKPGQRKVIFGCFKRKLKTEIKVAQLVGYIGEKTAYHHGEQSLATTIINLAQTFVGANNVNLLCPNGQYGTRATGGKDHASPRYIFTLPSPVSRTVFHPADDALLKYLEDDGDKIEPEWYMPVVPMVLVNGSEGIGTGWSTSIPNYNPADIVDNIKRLLRDEPQKPMAPWYRGFKGVIEKNGEGRYAVHGVVKKIDDQTIEITELPIGVWTQTYKEQLEEWVVGTEKVPACIKDYKEHHTNTSVHFVLSMTPANVEKAEKEGLLKFFKCSSSLSVSNMICFDSNGKLKKYTSPEEIIEDFFPLRLSYYQKRKDYLCNELRNQWEKLSNQARFVQMIIDKKLVISRKKKSDLVVELRKLGFRPFPKIAKAKEAGEDMPVAEEEEDDVTSSTSSDYDYLLGMPIWSLTEERVARLLRDQGLKEEELNALLSVKPSELWEADLDKFLDDWEKITEGDLAQGRKTAKNKKGATLKTRKSLTKGKKKAAMSDSEDDFMPSKAAPSKKQTTLDKTAFSAKPRVASKAKAILDGGDGFESDPKDDVKPPPKPKPKPKPAPPKAKQEPEELVDTDYDEPPVVKKKPGVKKPALPESDSDIEMEAPAKAKAKPSSKRKSMGGSEEEDELSSDKPTKKPKGLGKGQPSVSEFFAGPSAKARQPSKSKSDAPAKTARKPSAQKKQVIKDDSDDDDPPVVVKKTVSKKKIAVSSEGSGSEDVIEVPKKTAPAPPRGGPKRAAATSKTKYIDAFESDDNGDDSVFSVNSDDD